MTYLRNAIFTNTKIYVMKVTRKQIFSLAWKLFKAGIFKNFSDSLRAAWRQALDGLNHVTFVKKDGTHTTRRIALLNRFYTPKGNTTRKPTSTLKFADLDKIEQKVSNFIISFNPEQVIHFA